MLDDGDVKATMPPVAETATTGTGASALVRRSAPRPVVLTEMVCVAPLRRAWP